MQRNLWIMGGDGALCKSFVIRSMEWFDEYPDAHPNNNNYKVHDDIVNSNGEKLLDVLIEIDDGCTGAQMGRSISHAVYAAINGWEKYIEEMEKRKDEK